MIGRGLIGLAENRGRRHERGSRCGSSSRSSPCGRNGSSGPYGGQGWSSIRGRNGSDSINDLDGPRLQRFLRSGTNEFRTRVDHCLSLARRGFILLVCRELAFDRVMASPLPRGCGFLGTQKPAPAVTVEAVPPMLPIHGLAGP
jgi:hypothetical protein